MFTGCSHAGVVNASKHAVELGGGSVPLYAVVGGFHLVDGDKKKLESTVKDLKELNPKLLVSHHSASKGRGPNIYPTVARALFRLACKDGDREANGRRFGTFIRRDDLRILTAADPEIGVTAM